MAHDSHCDHLHGLSTNRLLRTTFSTNFPKASPYQNQLRGTCEVFITKINAAENALVYSTYLGGTGDQEGYGLAVDSQGGAYVTGYIDSSDFPTLNAGKRDVSFSCHAGL